MASGIYKALNIEEQEKRSVLLLMVQSVFLGTFYGAFDVGAMALFLEHFDSSQLGMAFLISGLSGVIMTSVYTHLQERVSFAKLAVGNLVFVAVLTALLRIGFGILPEKLLVFTVFVLMGPLNILAILGFWGTVGRIFTLRQGKRLFGLIDAGQIVGIIISSFTIPILVVIGFKSRDTLLISSISILLAVVFQFVITRNFNLNPVREETAVEKPVRINFWKLLRGRYILMMSVFVVLSMLTAFFIHYSFLAVTDEQYPDVAELTQFLGLFTGSMMVFIILIKTFVYSRLMKTYGLQLSLVLSPLLLGLFTLAAVIVGIIFGYTLASVSFLMFFMVIALSKLFSRALKDSIEAPSFKLLYQSLDQEIRYDVQARIDGTINEFAATASGFILMIMGSITLLKLIHYSVFLLIIIGAWTLVAFLLYREYKVSLKASLAAFKRKTGGSAVREESGTLLQAPEKLVSSVEEFYNYEAFYSSYPDTYEQFLVRQLTHNDPEIKRLTAREISRLCLTRPLKVISGNFPVISDLDETGATHVKVLSRLQKFTGDSEQVAFLTRSKNIEDRLLAASLIAAGDDEIHKLLLTLLRDQSDRVVKVAIRTAGSLAYAPAAPYVVDFLMAEKHLAETYDTLLKIGADALDYLEQAYHKTQSTHSARIRIIQLYTGIGGEHAKQLLLAKILESDTEILYQVLRGLLSLGYSAEQETTHQLFQVLERIIGMGARNIASLASLKDQGVEGPVAEALHEELTHNYDLVFLLLSLVYEPESVQHVRNNLESGTLEGAGFAMELLDVFVAEQMKPILFPLLEDISPDDKISALQSFFPIEKKPAAEVLLSLINADYNQINIWTKACAIMTLKTFKDPILNEDIIAQFFNPDDMLRQTALRFARDLEPGILENIVKRIENHGSRDNLITFRRTLNQEEIPFYDLVERLRKIEIFTEIPGRTLYMLARAFSLYQSEEEEVLDLSHPVYFITGRFRLYSGDHLVEEITGPRLLTSWTLRGLGELRVEEAEKNEVYVLSRDKWDSILIDSQSIMQKFFNLIKSS